MRFLCGLLTGHKLRVVWLSLNQRVGIAECRCSALRVAWTP